MKRGRKYEGYGEEYNVVKGEIITSSLLKAVGKNIRWGRWEGDLKVWGRKSRFESDGGGKNIKL